MAGWPLKDRQDDVVLLFLELEDELHSFEPVPGTEIDGGSRTEKIHSFRTIARPRLNIFKIKAGLFLLKKYSHTLHTAPH
jgi:hypothetical protein